MGVSISPQFARARDLGYEAWADDCVDVAELCREDFAAVNKAKLIVDTKKWMLAWVLPRRYGDRIATEITGKDGGPIEIEGGNLELARRVAYLCAMASNSSKTTRPY